MEQRKGYIESQTDIIARMLKKILEKLLKLKSTDVDDSQSVLQQSIYAEGNAFTLEDLLRINDEQLVAVVTNQYGYNAENIKALADILYEMDNSRKALILYRYYLSTSPINIDYTVFSRVNSHEANEW